MDSNGAAIFRGVQVTKTFRSGEGELVVFQDLDFEVARGEQLALVVIDEMLQERAAETLNHRADELALERQRIDHAPAIFDRHIIDQRDLPGFDVDRHVGGMRTI